ncbi:MAG: hypothetical protein P0111_14400 [Nitrospira sp.]|nr:hypothetical protein [Nitrospira sp.]
MSDQPRMKLEPFEAALYRLPDGPALADAFQKHIEEVIGLVNTNRRVGVVWQRYKGPLFVRAAVQQRACADISIPEEVEGVSLEMLMLQMADVLQRHGSQGLRSAIAEHALRIFRLARERCSLAGIRGAGP